MKRIRKAEWRRLWISPIFWIGIIIILGMELYQLSSKTEPHSEQQYWENCLNAAQTELDQWNNPKKGSDTWNTLSEEDKVVIQSNKKEKERAGKALKAIKENDWNTEVKYRYERAKEQLEDYQMRPKSEQGDLFRYKRNLDYYEYLMEKKIEPMNTNRINSMADALVRIPDKIIPIIGIFIVLLGAVSINRDKRKKAWNGFVMGGFSERSIAMAKLGVAFKTVFVLFGGSIIVVLIYSAISYGFGGWEYPQTIMDSVFQFGRKTVVITVYEQLMWKLWIYIAYLIFMAGFGVMLSALIWHPALSFGIAVIVCGVTYIAENQVITFPFLGSFYEGLLFQYGNTEHIANGSVQYITALLLLIGAFFVSLAIIWFCSIPVKRKAKAIRIETIHWISIPFLKGKTPVVIHPKRWEEESLEELARNWNSSNERKASAQPNWMTIMPDPPFYSEMTMAQNLSYYETIYGFSKEDTKSLIEKMNLSEYQNIKMKKCSPSVYWKFWMLICHLKKPELLIIDWPIIREEKDDLELWEKWINREIVLGREVVIASDGKDEWMKNDFVS